MDRPHWVQPGQRTGHTGGIQGFASGKQGGQPSFTDLQVAGLGSPRAAKFFADCERLIDFDKLAATLTEAGLAYRNDSRKGGAPNWSVALMLKVAFVQKAFALSDSMAEQMLLDRISFRSTIRRPTRRRSGISARS